MNHPLRVLELLGDLKEALEFHDAKLRVDMNPLGEAQLELRMVIDNEYYNVPLGCELDRARCVREIEGEEAW